MRKVFIPNPTVDNTYRTYVNSDYSSGTSLTVGNNASFATDNLIIVGNPREELTEGKRVSSISGSTILNLASALSFAHPKGTPVFRIYWDFVYIERRTTSTGTFALISESPIQWDNKKNVTVYIDSPATDTYEYRYRFYNSVTVTYSEYSATRSGAAQARGSVGYMIQQVRILTNDEDRKIIPLDDEIIRSLNRAQDIIYAHNPKYWFLYVDTYELGSLSIAATINEDVYTLVNLTRFGHLSGLKYRYLSGANDIIYQLRRVSEAEFDRIDSDQNITDDNWPTIYKLIPADASSANGYFKVTPDILASSIGVFWPLYYEKMANLDTVDDVTQVPLPDLLVDYAIGHVEMIKGNDAKAKSYQAPLVNVTKENLIRTPPGLVMLDRMDAAQRKAVGQPQNLVTFKGQKAIKRYYGNKYPGVSRDFIRENYFT